MNVYEVAATSIKVAKYNPKNRATISNSFLKSIEDNGILVPLIIDKELNLIDGHRRLKSAIKLKLDKVPVLEIDTNLSKNRAYEIINTTSKKISNHDIIYIYINGGSVSDGALIYILEIESLIGKAGLRRLSNMNVTYTIIRYAKIIAKYCKSTDDKFLIKTLNWLAEHKMIYYARRAMESRINYSILSNAIKKNKPLQINYK